ncbi:MAG: tetratricopeptide repeat protein [Rhodocyclaceae bacterium]|uniref:tetratricopeptide repeat protein n=1 Tax=Sulfuricystis thermophila TaxID=2496847 RepID=UPI001036256B|nr:tetratricopeptide repeat protein [Sulfuricystis thermophila]MDI6750441.1 tetratricopeptide repeat protein [Rhodocyclaceae bacterium]
MATYDLEEQEQIEELKTWWKMHGTLVTSVVVAFAVAVVGWQVWQWWQRNEAAKAAQLFGNLQQALAQQDVKRVRLLAGELVDKHAGTAYAGMAAMVAGKVLAETGDLKSAQAQYGWAAEHATDQGTRDLARLRQAIVLIEEKSFDEALKLLAVPPTPNLMARFLEVRGDVLAAQGKTKEARSAYEEAIKALEADRQAEGLPPGPYLDILKDKRDAIGVAS